jgi:hypothetical protein
LKIGIHFWLETFREVSHTNDRFGLISLVSNELVSQAFLLMLKERFIAVSWLAA